MAALQPARLTWLADGSPYAVDYQDRYFSAQGGLAETRCVFLSGNGLPERWRDRPTFTLVETGLGTGLNLLATWALWRRTRRPGQRLTYVAIERHPLTPDDAARALRPWDELAGLRARFLAAYPPLVPGFQTLELGDPSLRVLLIFESIETGLEAFRGGVDAWFLDGFAPARNPAMWDARVYTAMAARSRPGCTVATYAAAGQVRRGLEAAGFTLERHPGFAGKRERLVGTWPDNADDPGPDPTAPPWYRLPNPPAIPRGRALVIGAGLAGCGAAEGLARRGWSVTLTDPAGIAGAASGNLAGTYLPLITKGVTARSQFSLAAFGDLVNRLHRLRRAGHWVDAIGSGLWQVFGDPEEAERLRAGIAAHGLEGILADERTGPAASARVGTSLAQGGLWFPAAGALDPRQLCRALLQAGGLSPPIRARVAAITPADPTLRGAGWRAWDTAGQVIAEADVVVIANGAEARTLVPSVTGGLRRVRGQVSHFRATPASAGLRVPLSFGAYATPHRGGLHAVGATFDLDDPDLTPRYPDDQANQAALEQAFPALATGIAPPLEARVAHRTSVPDHLPMVGPIPDGQAFAEAYTGLHHGRPTHRYPPADYRPGLYLSVAHGARGIVTAPFAGELLAGQVSGEPLPLPGPVLDAIHPARFWVRALRRGQPIPEDPRSS